MTRFEQRQPRACLRGSLSSFSSLSFSLSSARQQLNSKVPVEESQGACNILVGHAKDKRQSLQNIEATSRGVRWKATQTGISGRTG